MWPLNAPEVLSGVAATSPGTAGLWQGLTAAPPPQPPAWGWRTLHVALKSVIPMAVCCVKLYPTLAHGGRGQI